MISSNFLNKVNFKFPYYFYWEFGYLGTIYIGEKVLLWEKRVYYI